MDTTALQLTVRSAFASLTRPAAEEIATCTCGECQEIRHDFARAEPEDLPDSLMGYHAYGLGFMTPPARLYFLRGWMELAITRPHRSYGDAVCGILGRDDGWLVEASANPAQLAAILEFLRHLESSEGERPDPALAGAMDRVGTLARAAGEPPP